VLKNKVVSKIAQYRKNRHHGVTEDSGSIKYKQFSVFSVTLWLILFKQIFALYQFIN